MNELPKIMVAICTFRRNDPLRVLLRALQAVADTATGRARIGVVVVDDNDDRRARAVVDEFQGAFALGCHYRHSGQKNISLARNMAVDTASADSDWVAMIDDDCEPEPTWLCAFLDVIEATGADCVTGAMQLAGSARFAGVADRATVFRTISLFDLPDRRADDRRRHE